MLHVRWHTQYRAWERPWGGLGVVAARWKLAFSLVDDKRCSSVPLLRAACALAIGTSGSLGVYMGRYRLTCLSCCWSWCYRLLHAIINALDSGVLGSAMWPAGRYVIEDFTSISCLPGPLLWGFCFRLSPLCST